jgi:putative membrane protein
MPVIAMMHDDGDAGHMMTGWMSAWMGLWGLLALALIVLAVAATVWLIRHASDGGSGSEAARTLERRYAAGEIDREEFLQRREDLARRR